MGRAFEVRKASIQKNGAIRGKIYTNYAKTIYLAAKKGTPDLETNITLKRLVDKAKKEQVPNDIINRAIEKAKGTSNDDYQEVTYEGFGPGDSTFIIKCLTDNVNRTVGHIRAALNKVNKSLGVTNSVSYNYDYLAIIAFVSNKEEAILDSIVDNNINIIDLESENGEITITLHPGDICKVKDILEKDYSLTDFTLDEVGLYPKDTITLENEDKELFLKLYHLLEEIDDITEIYHNVRL